MRDLRDYIGLLKERGWLEEIVTPVSTVHEIPALLSKHDGKRAVAFTEVKSHKTAVYGNLCCRREFIATGMGVQPLQIAEKIISAMNSPIKPTIHNDGPSQETRAKSVDLTRDLPILTHYEHDKGPYITGGVTIANDPETGRPNVSYHRMMVIGKKRLVARLVEGRDLHRFYSASRARGKPLEAAVVLGAPLELLIAAATSPGEMSEFDVAGGLSNAPLELLRCGSIAVEVPRYAEIVLEGRFLLEQATEGPFVDITGTYDVVREQPVFEVSTITHRKSAFYQAILPGGQEHLLLMGMPREAKILGLVRSVSKVRGVALSRAGSNWLDAAISIKKTHQYEPFLTGMAALTAHYSLKRVIVVDEDVDVNDFVAVEKAVLERAHPVDDYFIVGNVKGSSLDKSGIRSDGRVLPPAKLVIDATMKGERMYFEGAKIPQAKGD